MMNFFLLLHISDAPAASIALNSELHTDSTSQINKKHENKSRSTTKSSTVNKKATELMQALRVNSSIPISWDQEAVKDRLFTLRDCPETQNKYIELNSDTDMLSDTENFKIANICSAIGRVRKNKDFPTANMPTANLPPPPALCSDRPRSKTVPITDFFESKKTFQPVALATITAVPAGESINTTNHSVSNKDLNSSATLTPIGKKSGAIDLGSVSNNNRRYSIAYSNYSEQSGLHLNITVPSIIAVNENSSINLPHRFSIASDVSIRPIPPANESLEYQQRQQPQQQQLQQQKPIRNTTVSSPVTIQPINSPRNAAPLTADKPTVPEPVIVSSTINALKILSPNEVNMKAVRTANINNMAQNSINNNINNGSLNRSPSVQYNNNDSSNTNDRISSQYHNNITTLNHNHHLQQQQQHDRQPYNIDEFHPNRMHHLHHHLFPTQPPIPNSTSTSTVPSQGSIVRPIALTPRPTPSPDSSSTIGIDPPIQVSLIREKSGYIELVFKKNTTRILYTDMSDEQRIEVQKSLMTCDVWLKMLDYIKDGQPSKATLNLFKKLLPPTAMSYFFRTLGDRLSG